MMTRSGMSSAVQNEAETPSHANRPTASAAPPTNSSIPANPTPNRRNRHTVRSRRDGSRRMFGIETATCCGTVGRDKYRVDSRSTRRIADDVDMADRADEYKEAAHPH